MARTPEPHLDDTDLVGLDRHFPKLSGDQDLALLGDCGDANGQRETNARKSERRIGPLGGIELSSCLREMTAKNICNPQQHPTNGIFSPLTNQKVPVRVVETPGTRGDTDPVWK